MPECHRDSASAINFRILCMMASCAWNSPVWQLSSDIAIVISGKHKKDVEWTNNDAVQTVLESVKVKHHGISRREDRAIGYEQARREKVFKIKWGECLISSKPSKSRNRCKFGIQRPTLTVNEKVRRLLTKVITSILMVATLTYTKTGVRSSYRRLLVTVNCRRS